MDENTRDDLISRATASGKTGKRNCKICKKEFTGLRIVCGDECHWRLQTILKYNKSLNPMEYDSIGRLPYLVTKFIN